LGRHVESKVLRDYDLLEAERSAMFMKEEGGVWHAAGSLARDVDHNWAKERG